MVALSRLAAAGLVAGALSSRVERKSKGEAFGKKTIAGVPVVNYQFAHKNAEADELTRKNEIINWNVIGKQGMTKEEMKEFCGDACPLHGHPFDGGVPFATFIGTEDELAAAFQRSAGTKWRFVEPDIEVRVSPEVAPQATTLWGLRRIGRDSAQFKGKGSNIYVTDTGVRVTHSDFGGRAKTGADVTSGKVVACAGSTGCAVDRNGHGTHCAGTTAGTNYGVAPQATVYSAKVLGDDGRGSLSWSAAALDWVATRGAKPAVVSMSLGGSGVSSSQRVAVQTAVRAGVVVVVAAGNENSNACNFSPAYVPEAITVGSTTSSDTRSSFSNYGTCVNIWGPGSSILSAAHSSDTGSTTKSGTSMACPHVAGASALMLQQNPAAGASGVLAALTRKAFTGKISGLQSGDTNKLLCVGGCPA